MTPALLSIAPALADDQQRRDIKIERTEVFPYVYPMAGYFKFFDGAHGKGRPAVFLKLTASDGMVGWGQAVPIAKWSYETLETSVVVLRDYFAPLLIGQATRSTR